MFFWPTLIFAFGHCVVNAQQICNGLPGLCGLRIHQVTLAGTHNSGSGFDSHLRYGRGILALSCFYRNQGKSITGQLELGIRYFDIDTCWNNYEKTSYTCHESAYGGKISKFLQQVDKWMKKNANEVVVLHFNRDYDKGGDPEKLGKDIIDQIKGLWNPTRQRLTARELSVQTRLYSTLGAAINRNQRIYVFMHDNLSQQSENWLYTNDYIGYTWIQWTFISSWGCQKLANAVAEKCSDRARERRFVRLDLYLSSGLCIDDLASWCNTLIRPSTEKCRKNARVHGRTVNFIVVDYADLGSGRDVVKVAREENLKNVNYFG